MTDAPLPANDLQNRMVPSVGDLQRAFTALEANGTELAVTPMIFVGKEYGIWTNEVQVETTTLVYACNNDDSFRAARDEACVAGAKILGERPGTVGYAIHRLVDGEVASSMFEDIISPLRWLEIDSEAASQ